MLGKMIKVYPLEEDMVTTPVSGLGNPMDRGDWWAAVYGVTESWTCLSD